MTSSTSSLLTAPAVISIILNKPAYSAYNSQVISKLRATRRGYLFLALYNKRVFLIGISKFTQSIEKRPHTKIPPILLTSVCVSYSRIVISHILISNRDRS